MTSYGGVPFGRYNPGPIISENGRRGAVRLALIDTHLINAMRFDTHNFLGGILTIEEPWSIVRGKSIYGMSVRHGPCRIRYCHRENPFISSSMSDGHHRDATLAHVEGCRRRNTLPQSVPRMRTPWDLAMRSLRAEDTQT